jgi:large subunit ribosomal protein L29
MKAKEIRELSLSEIEKKVRDSKDELVRLRLRKQTGQVETPHLLKELRRDLARMETIVKEKKQADTAKAVS